MGKRTLMECLNTKTYVWVYSDRELRAFLQHCEALRLRWSSGRMPTDFIPVIGSSLPLTLGDYGLLYGLGYIDHENVNYRDIIDRQECLRFNY